MRQLGVEGEAAAWRWVGLWVAVVVILVVPWRGWVDHAHWARVQWVPFLSGPLRLRDVVANVLLYVPLGYLLTRSARVGAHWALAAGLFLSVATEITQVYSHDRFPSLTDVTCNAFGTWLGTRRRRLQSAG